MAILALVHKGVREVHSLNVVEQVVLVDDLFVAEGALVLVGCCVEDSVLFQQVVGICQF